MDDMPDSDGMGRSEHDHYGMQDDRWSEDPWLLLRWLPGEPPDDDITDDTKLLGVAANILGVNVAELALRDSQTDRRLMIFEFAGESDGAVAPAHLRWQEAVASSPHLANASLLAEGASLVDTSFPAYLNVTLCNLLGMDSGDAGSEHKSPSTPGIEAGLAAEVNDSIAP